MFVETITQPRDEWLEWNAELRFHEEPPEGLVASVAWNSGDDEITSLNVWDTPGAVSDFYVERVAALVQSHGEPTGKPRRHGEPVSVYLRD